MSIHHPKRRIKEHLNDARETEISAIGEDTPGRKVYPTNAFRTSHASERTDVLKRGRQHRIDDDTPVPEEHAQHSPFVDNMLGRSAGRLSRSIPAVDNTPLGRIIAEIRARKQEAALPEFGDVWVDEAPGDTDIALPAILGSTGRQWSGDGHDSKPKRGNAKTKEVSLFRQECQEILAKHYTPDNLEPLVDRIVLALVEAMNEQKPMAVMAEGAIRLNNLAIKRLDKLGRELKPADVLEALGF